MVYAGQDPKNNLEITARGGGSSTVGEDEEGLGVVCDDHHTLADIVFLGGGS